MNRIFLKPAPMVIDGEPVERRVRKPTGQVLAAAGEEVNFDTYWQRRLKDGDVVEMDKPVEQQADQARTDPDASSAASAASTPRAAAARK